MVTILDTKVIIWSEELTNKVADKIKNSKEGLVRFEETGSWKNVSLVSIKSLILNLEIIGITMKCFSLNKRI